VFVLILFGCHCLTPFVLLTGLSVVVAGMSRGEL